MFVCFVQKKQELFHDTADTRGKDHLFAYLSFDFLIRLQSQAVEKMVSGIGDFCNTLHPDPVC